MNVLIEQNPIALTIIKGEIYNILSLLRSYDQFSSEERFKKEIPIHVNKILIYRHFHLF